MALAIDATAGGSNANSYVTVSEADDVALYRIGGNAFSVLDDDEKIQALATAAMALDALPWVGTRSTESQAMEWPRVFQSTTTGVPKWLKSAQIELAVSYSAVITTPGSDDPLSTSATGAMQSVKVGPVALSFAVSAKASELAATVSHLPRIVQELVLPWLYIASDNGAYGVSRSARSS